MLLTVNRLKETISGVIGNDKYSVPFDKDKYQSLLALEVMFENATTMQEAQDVLTKAKEVTKRSSSSVIESICPYLKLNPNNNQFYIHQNGKTSSIAVPKVLADKIIESAEKEISFEPLVKAWIWFLRNPKFTPAKAEYFAKYLTTTVVDPIEKQRLIDEEGYSDEKAEELATYNDIFITKNGLLGTYKYAQIKYKKFNGVDGSYQDRYPVTYDEETGEAKIQLPADAEDFYLIPPIMGEGGDAFTCGAALGHRIKVGEIHALASFDQINCRDGSFGGGGLHLGGRRYIRGYGGAGRLLLNVFVNPMHIGGFSDSGDGAIRVKEYFVHSSHFAPNKQLYHESNYAAHTEAQWAEMREEAISKSEEAIKKLMDYKEEINAF